MSMTIPAGMKVFVDGVEVEGVNEVCVEWGVTNVDGEPRRLYLQLRRDSATWHVNDAKGKQLKTLCYDLHEQADYMESLNECL